MQENELNSSVSTEEQDGACTHRAAWRWGAPCTALRCSDCAAQPQAEQCPSKSVTGCLSVHTLPCTAPLPSHLAWGGF